MSRYINKFSTVNDLQNALNNGDLSKPYVGYVVSTESVDFNTLSPVTPVISGPLKLVFGTVTSEDPQETPILYANEGDFEYSIDNGETWEDLGDSTNPLEVQEGDEVLLRGDNHRYTGSHNTAIQVENIEFEVEGNIMSCYDSTGYTTVTEFQEGETYVFQNYFYHNTGLTSAENLILPVTTLVQGCYEGMFEGCSNLTTGPATLPATTMAESCYQSMFNECSSLETAPALPATTLADSCYAMMFAVCESLTTAPALPATNLENMCYYNMLAECGSLTTAPVLSATTMAESCYAEMFVACTGLTTAPALPATTLAENCYEGMFGDCTFLTTAPELPATVLVDGCYMGMFSNCQNLEEVKCNATDISAPECVEGWLDGASETGTLYKNPEMEDWVEGDNIPSGWTIEDWVENE